MPSLPRDPRDRYGSDAPFLPAAEPLLRPVSGFSVIYGLVTAYGARQVLQWVRMAIVCQGEPPL